MNQKSFIKLTTEERQQRVQLLSSSIVPARTLTHARIVLK
jgi:hypothetical protein